MKRVLSIFLLVIFICPLFAEDLSIDEINSSISAIIDTSYVAASQFLSFQDSEIPTIAIRVPQGKMLPDAIIVNEADLSSFIQYYPEQTGNSSASLLSPVKSTVRQQLQNSNWRMGEAIVTGVAAPVFSQDQSIFSLISGALNGVFPRVGLVTDFTVEGSDFSQPVHVQGTFIIGALADTSIDITTVELRINDKVYNID
jgi:hypothetical protein